MEEDQDESVLTNFAVAVLCICFATIGVVLGSEYAEDSQPSCAPITVQQEGSAAQAVSSHNLLVAIPTE